ncbi:MAG: hypothetical protein A2431_01295 [Candidatus Zambryskibacteria bacterium RIFOXYC1_FULL_39_10]|uniref:Protein kinase domain-containing protein n=1 Tax=Candidatus Zambryskibacteria bacterium RIFOXYC1_FULL_39_10 TaxID=1802779 RepID=A0A1G2UZB8_9BACT|nr:MAG: hypothetical protein A2431_01295 [Candidatus Zambryskibacteria bacterium RIFOXYC1_FULL_39_10]OHB16588.1 MAG: hypothetical protein A2605_04150 [Candidatus Zambryskibacteria bacterium RIFOXYD1_FULL_39_35]
METDKYLVGKLLGETDEFRLYQCKLPDGGVGILKIAVSPAQNGILDREAFILQTLRDEALCCEEDYQKENSGKVLNYQICFPNLIESFVSPDRGDRRINIVNFMNISDDLSRLVPIDHVINRDQVRVDPRTSAWIMGKILKLLSFAHGQGISIGRITGENILLECGMHYIVFFDWSHAMLHPNNEVPVDVASNEISQAARIVISLLGGDPNTGELPPDNQLEDDRYARHLLRLSKGEEGNSCRAHEEFYRLIRSTLGWRGFHPFTSYSLERS